LLLSGGCGSNKGFDGPTVDAFIGKVAKDGTPISIPEGERVVVRLIHHGSAQQFGVRIAEDATFEIGWMPIGKYSVTLERPQKDDGPRIKTRMSQIHVKQPFEIVEGQTEYNLELGDAWQSANGKK
jgi:hypothetical protein